MKIKVAMTFVIMTAVSTLSLPLTPMSSRQIQIHMNGQFLAITSNGVINATDNAHDVSTVWQRHAVNTSSILLRSVSYCWFLCINECGYTYTTRVPIAECIWVEKFEDSQHYTYIYRPMTDKKLYLALNNQGKTRRIVLSNNETLGKYADYTASVYSDWNQLLSVDGSLCPSVKTMRMKLNYHPDKKCIEPVMPTVTTKKHHSHGTHYKHKPYDSKIVMHRSLFHSRASPNLLNEALVNEDVNNDLTTILDRPLLPGLKGLAANMTESPLIVDDSADDIDIVDTDDDKDEFVDADEYDEGVVEKNFYSKDTEPSLSIHLLPTTTTATTTVMPRTTTTLKLPTTVMMTTTHSPLKTVIEDLLERKKEIDDDHDHDDRSDKTNDSSLSTSAPRSVFYVNSLTINNKCSIINR
ncbi:fibroblast growth factor [Clanis bilineata nucleopolyhedrovirus]|uniref:Fibroblast growth factor n=1 Tax=Clanis bilineata nucleopolyhedrovirus TaxID=1307957 RepID=Q0N3Y4_9ABAC|nr:fibroblast growth factor [Clanis bilineata nucleopolyhedrovirus]ABF47459.1 fibroblast growth factor [Clanis bilineata nucleopolyhedrovirus]